MRKLVLVCFLVQSIIVFGQENEHWCGTCETKSLQCNAKENQLYSSNSAKTTKANVEQMPDNDVLKVYRLALLIDYPIFIKDFGGNSDKVKQWWGSIEKQLNEIYMRDLGVKFQVVKDEKLIIQTEAEKLFEKRDGNHLFPYSTQRINTRVDANSYDVGVSFTDFSNAKGFAENGGVYLKKSKGNSIVNVLEIPTIAHEIGHLFGSLHTADGQDVYSYKTEVGDGSSIMSYSRNYPRDFFSLPSIYYMRERLGKIPYYSDEHRNKIQGESKEFDNYPLGIKTNNSAPVIDENQLKKEYILPKNTFFQFKIPVTDKENNRLSYVAHPADFYEKAKSKFLTLKSTDKNEIDFQTKYDAGGNPIDYSTPNSIGDYTFWLGVNDSSTEENYKTRYDIFETKVKIVDKMPFQITSKPVILKTGEHYSLKWNVDNEIFKGTKVRILLSDDLGKTFKYSLVDETENDGECEVIMPLHTIESKKYGNFPDRMKVRQGVFKVEVLEHIAYALSDFEPIKNNNAWGGFSVMKSSISFAGLPKEYIELSNENEIPQAHITATCGRETKPLQYTEEKQGNIIRRIWTAEMCGEKSSFVQRILIKEKENTLATTEHKEVSKSISLYPNPVSNEFYLKGIENIREVKIFDFTGRIVKSFGKQEVYNISDLPKGVYIVVVNGEEKIKIIKD